MAASYPGAPLVDAARGLRRSGARRNLSPGAARAWWPIQSSKLAGPGSPRLGRFDSFAASFAGRIVYAGTIATDFLSISYSVIPHGSTRSEARLSRDCRTRQVG